MFKSEATSVPMCTVRRHPISGYSPVLHLSSAPVPAPSVGTISFPRIEQARQYARDHFGTGMVRVADDCASDVQVGDVA